MKLACLMNRLGMSWTMTSGAALRGTMSSTKLTGDWLDTAFTPSRTPARAGSHSAMNGAGSVDDTGVASGSLNTGCLPLRSIVHSASRTAQLPLNGRPKPLAMPCAGTPGKSSGSICLQLHSFRQVVSCEDIAVSWRKLCWAESGASYCGVCSGNVVVAATTQAPQQTSNPGSGRPGAGKAGNRRTYGRPKSQCCHGRSQR